MSSKPCKAGEFKIYAVGTIDEGIEVLTGTAAGERDGKGGYPEGSVNDRVQKKLRQFSAQLKQMAAASGGERLSVLSQKMRITAKNVARNTKTFDSSNRE
jgi:hypothetical protein